MRAVAADDEGFRHAVDAPLDRGAAIAVDAVGDEGIAIAAEKAPRIVGLVLVVDAGDAQRWSAASFISSGASSWQGTHHDAQTLSTVTSPLNVRAVDAGHGLAVALERRRAAAGWWAEPAGRSSADGMREGSPAPSRNMNSAREREKRQQREQYQQRRRHAPASLSIALSSVVLTPCPSCARSERRVIPCASSSSSTRFSCRRSNTIHATSPATIAMAAA